MARQARKKSQSGIYHIVMRGINRQFIFEDDYDKEKFIQCLKWAKGVCQFEIYGYCLMDNHIHLVIKENQEDIASIMKRIGVRYVSWYNRKYHRCGHLFQDRFRSEVVETDQYLMTVLRYIHQNPLKAGLVEDIEAYKWSSYSEYVNSRKIIDTELLTSLLGVDKDLTVKAFQRFMSEKSANDTGIIEYDNKVVLTDLEAQVAIRQVANLINTVEMQSMERETRDQYLRKIKEIPGITTRQIARITGISQSVITRA